MASQTYQINGKPYFIIETDKGIFKAMSAYSIKDNTINWHNNEELGDLVLGRDIAEVPARSLTLIVKVNKNEKDTSHLIEECKKFTSITMYDYFSFEKYGNCLATFICEQGNNNVFEFKPRLFKKIVNN